jgi:branched-chain amino acid transport system substrate-binding protein
MKRREFLAASTAVLLTPFIVRAEETPGVTATEIKIGNTNAYSGPVAQASGIAKAETAFLKLLTHQSVI